jgi:putative flippase GtrA
MARRPARTEGHVPWRRRALTVGAVATLAWGSLLLLSLTDGVRSTLGSVSVWLAVVLSFLTSYLLQRMWSDGSYAASKEAVLGRRLSAAFEILIAVVIVLGLADVGVPLQLVLAYTAVACFLAALVLAVPRPGAE